MIVTIDEESKLNDLKRIIEREYFNIFSQEKNFVCLNIQDEFGYNLTFCNCLGKFLKNNDRIIVVYTHEYK